MKTTVIAIVTLTMISSASIAQADDVSLTDADQLRATGVIKSDKDLQAIALGLHPGASVYETELEKEFTRYEYKVELRDTQGQHWDLEIDAATGEVYENERDD